MTIPENGAETFWDCVEQATADEDYEALQACQNLYEPMAPAETDDRANDDRSTGETRR